ncbi:hypothetical protein KKB55_08965 [Myxococcota bacterium]|nr:hypothetical protein [Myxococcota bacterium]MBU1897864.1 hypothetical protein [Myxococcota bacterium]
MGVPLLHIRHQGPVLSAMGRVILSGLKGDAAHTTGAEGDTLRDRVPARDQRLVDDYIRWAGGDPRAWRGLLPPHLFPQWGFPLMGRTLEGSPYPLTKVVNGGCSIEIKQPLLSKRPLDLSARLASVDDDGHRAVLNQELITRNAGGEEAIVATVYGVVPLKKREGAKKPRALVPADAREIAWLRLGPREGLSFACLTGDFNPIHWLPPYAKAAGFGRTILHGFGTLAKTMEAMNRVLWANDVHRLQRIDVRFTRPLRLPARVGVYVKEDGVFVGDAPGAPAYLTGTFNTRKGESV